MADIRTLSPLTDIFQKLTILTMFQIPKGDPLVSLDFFENPMAHPRMKVQVLGSLKLPLAKKNFGEKSVGKHDLFLSFFSKFFSIFLKSLESKVWTYLD